MKKLIAILAMSLISSVGLAKSIVLTKKIFVLNPVDWRIVKNETIEISNLSGTTQQIFITLNKENSVDPMQPPVPGQPIEITQCRGTGVSRLLPNNSIICSVPDRATITWRIDPTAEQNNAISGGIYQIK